MIEISSVVSLLAAAAVDTAPWNGLLMTCSLEQRRPSTWLSKGGDGERGGGGGHRSNGERGEAAW